MQKTFINKDYTKLIMPFKRAKLTIRKNKLTNRFVVIAKRADGRTRIVGNFSSREQAKMKAGRLRKTGLVR